MKQKKRTVLAAITVACLLCSCSQTANGATTDNTATTTTTDATTLVTALDPETLFSTRDKAGDYDESQAVAITLSDTKATSSDSSKVSISASTATIQDEGVYILSGKLTNGQIIVDAEESDKVQLVLNGVTINNNTSAAIYVRQGDKVFVTLAKGTTNTLTNKDTFVAIDDNNIDGVVFAKDDITFNGSGTLIINAAYGSGVVAKDDLTITGGSYKVNAADHGFTAKDGIAIADGTFQITSGKDGFHCEDKDDATKGFIYVGKGSYDITAQGDGFDGASILQIEDGTFQIKTGSGSDATLAEDASAKGIKTTGNLLLSGGSFTLNCADDAYHSNANLTVKGGNYTIATGDDGFHADLAAVVEGGTIHITKSYEGIEGQTVHVSAGTVNIVSSDDGINAAESGEDSDEAVVGGEKGTMANGERPAFDDTITPPEKPAGDATTGATAKATDGTAGTAPTGNPPTGTEGAMPNRMGGGLQANENCDITITGGTITIDAKGDAIDSNGSIHISGGVIYITGPENNGNSCVDSDGDAVITGGILVACGSSSMFHGFSTDSTQGWALINLTEAQSGKVTLASGSTTLLSYTPTREYTAVLVSGSGIKKGSTYTLTMGDETKTFTMESLSYTSGTSSNGNMGGRGQMNGTKQNQTTTKATS
ncbi:carbohydrate-binding domain-containing protein [Anaerotignum sp.]|uniref:carbohydrate-binding domain-containing protein n=1 Tax=Anaerotignum sp. TaxID=2039241 RepID=UPI00289A5A9C|nr:carbohydrate-binding domain-containing protein [Anaerotignum sp.]